MPFAESVLRKIGKALRDAFDEGVATDDKGREKRERYSRAIFGLSKALRFGHFKEDYCDELNELGSALLDLNDGISRPFLTRATSKPTGRSIKTSPDPSYIWRARAAVCVGFIALTSAGLKPGEAAERIATKHRKKIQALLSGRSNARIRRTAGVDESNLRGKRQNPLAHTIREWNRALKDRRTKNVEGRAVYQGSSELARYIIERCPEKQKVSEADKMVSKLMKDVDVLIKNSE